MFARITKLLNKIFVDLQSTFIWIFAIGILISAIGVWAGGEENAPKFKKGLTLSIIGVIVFLLAKPMVDYVKANL